MKNGTVKFFNASKGFGFITEDDSNTEYFVHVTGIIDEINEGDAVEFEFNGTKDHDGDGVDEGLQEVWKPLIKCLFAFALVTLRQLSVILSLES